MHAPFRFAETAQHGGGNLPLALEVSQRDATAVKRTIFLTRIFWLDYRVTYHNKYSAFPLFAESNSLFSGETLACPCRAEWEWYLVR
jgi:hypothetical protein